MNGTKSKGAGVIFAIFASACFGLASVFGKLSYQGGNTAISLTFYRAVAAVAGLGILLKIMKIPLRIPRGQWAELLVLGVAGQTVTTVLLNMAYYYIPAGTAVTLHFIYPAIVTAACMLFFHEKVSSSRLIILAVIFCGTAGFFEGLGGAGKLGTTLAVCSSITWAFYFIFLERSSLSHINALLLTFWQCVILAAACFLWGTATGEMRYNLDPLGWAMALVSGLVFTAALAALQMGIQHAGATTASMLGVFEPISGIVFGVIILSESVTLRQTLGSVIIIVAIAWLIWINRETREVKSEVNSG